MNDLLQKNLINEERRTFPVSNSSQVSGFLVVVMNV